MVHPEPAEALLEGRQGRVVALLGVPELGGDEDLVAGDARGGDRRPDALLVAVGGGGVDVAVAGRERFLDHLLGLLGRDLEDAEPELGDLDAVVQRQGGNRSTVMRPLGVRRREPEGEQREGEHHAEEGADRERRCRGCAVRDLAPAMRPTRTKAPAIPRPIQKT